MEQASQRAYVEYCTRGRCKTKSLPGAMLQGCIITRSAGSCDGLFKGLRGNRKWRIKINGKCKDCTFLHATVSRRR